MVLQVLVVMVILVMIIPGRRGRRGPLDDGILRVVEKLGLGGHHRRIFSRDDRARERDEQQLPRRRAGEQVKRAQTRREKQN